MSWRSMAWVALVVVTLSGAAWADEVEEIVRQFQHDAQQIAAAAQKSVDSRRNDAARELVRLATELQVRGDEAGAAKAREVARKLTGGGAVEAPAAVKAAGKAEVLWGGTWFKATVLEQKDGKFFIKYDSYDGSWNEWVGQDRIRFVGGNPPAAQAVKPEIAKPEVAKKTEVLWNGTWYPAKVLEQKGGKFYIQYDGYTDTWNEWVGPDRIRFDGAAPVNPNKGAGLGVGSKAEVYWGSSWYPAVVVEQKDGKFLIKYDGYNDNWNEWVGTDRIRSLDGKAPAALKPDGAQLAPGKAVTVQWGGQWWPAKLLETKADKFYIQYDNHTADWNEWVGADRIRVK